jgi:MFS family permease
MDLAPSLPATKAPAPPASLRVLLLLLATLTVMAGATIAPSLPGMAEHFADVPRAHLLARLVLTLPALLIALSAFPAGWVVDRFGRKVPLLAGVLLYALAGASGLLVDSLGSILIGRAFLGIAVGIVMTTTMTLVGDLMQPPLRDRFMGMMAAFMSFGGVVFLTAGGLLAELGWRGPFAVYLLALPLLIAAGLMLPEPGARRHAPSGPQEPAPLRLAALVYGTALLHMVAFYIIPVQAPFLLREHGVMAPSLAGLAIAASTLASALAALAFRPMLLRLGHAGIFALGFAVFAAGYLVIGLAGQASVVAAGLVVAGIGGGIVMPNYGAWLLARTPQASRGRISGGLTASFFLGQFLSPLATQPIVGNGRLGPMFVAAAGGILLLALAYGLGSLGRGANPRAA